jgi:hypothetical protein
MRRGRWSAPRNLRKVFRKPLDKSGTFVGETPMGTRHEKENLESEPKCEEENVSQHDPAPSCRDLLKQPAQRGENQESRS